MILIIKNVTVEGPGIINDYFENSKRDVNIVDLQKGDILPGSTNGLSAIVVLGGPMNVYEENKYPFLRHEDILLKEAIEEQVPVLGICLGAQLLAKAAGAKVGKAPCEEIGWDKVSLTDEGVRDFLFKSIKREFDVFQWHEDQFEIPVDGVLLANSERCPHQAFRIGRFAYGFQFHIELTPEMIRSWIEEFTKKDKYKEFDGNAVINDLYFRTDGYVEQGNTILDNFTKLISIKEDMMFKVK